MLRASVEAFAHDEIAPRAAEIDRSERVPGRPWQKMGDLGVLGITVVEEYGGAGMGYLEHCVAMEEISRARPASACPTARIAICASTRSVGTATPSRSGNTCRSCVSGAHVGALAMSEPNAGSDVVGMRCALTSAGSR